MAIAASIAVTLLVATTTFRLFFKDFADFRIHLGYVITPDLLSALRGEYDEDRNSSFKVLLYFGIALLAGGATWFSFVG